MILDLILAGQTPRGFPAAMDETEITSGITLGPVCLLMPLMSKWLLN